jgi:SMC interacting uncharacterized protein involved in chromosome segregation
MRFFDKTRGAIGPWFVLGVAAFATGALAQGDGQVYRCPGNPVLYTDAINAKEARDKGCKQLDGTPITVIAAPKRMPAASTTASSAASRPAETRIDPNEQRARDSDARRILEGELRREEERLAEMRKEYNNGEPERRGEERNYQKYLDRVTDLKSGIARKESDIAALKRELSKLPQ